MNKLFFVVLSALLLSACSSRYASNGENLYMQSRNGVLLQVPSPLTRSNLSSFYVLPQQTGNPTISIAPPDSNITS